MSQPSVLCNTRLCILHVERGSLSLCLAADRCCSLLADTEMRSSPMAFRQRWETTSVAEKLWHFIVSGNRSLVECRLGADVDIGRCSADFSSPCWWNLENDQSFLMLRNINFFSETSTSWRRSFSKDLLKIMNLFCHHFSLIVFVTFRAFYILNIKSMRMIWEWFSNCWKMKK